MQPIVRLDCPALSTSAYDAKIWCSPTKTRTEFDPNKDHTDLVKHDVALPAALKQEDALVCLDDHADHGESRMIQLAPETGLLCYVAFLAGGPFRSIVSLRLANRREAMHCVQAE